MEKNRYVSSFFPGRRRRRRRARVSRKRKQAEVDAAAFYLSVTPVIARTPTDRAAAGWLAVAPRSLARSSTVTARPNALLALRALRGP